MKPADLARQNAIPLEVKKDGLQQRQNGDWVLRFVVQAADMDQRLTSAPMGTRFQVALVEIDDSEMPVSPAAKENIATPEVAKDKPPLPAKRTSRMDWRELQPAAQAGIRCADPVFRKFLEEQYHFDVEDIDEEFHAEMAAEFVRSFCNVASRSELGANAKARVIWHQLDSQFQAWQRVGA